MPVLKKTISLRLDDELMIKLTKIAQKLRVSQSDALRILIDECDIYTLQSTTTPIIKRRSVSASVNPLPASGIEDVQELQSFGQAQHSSDLLYNEEKLSKLKNLIKKSRSNSQDSSHTVSIDESDY